MKSLSSLLFVLLALSCGSIHVNYDYDTAVDFSQYKSYNYYSDMNTGLSTLDTKRFLDALDTQMAKKGYLLSGTPDFFIDISSSEYREASRSSVGVGMGGTGRHVGGGVSIGVPIGQSNINRQIKVEFVDENKKQLFWEAVCEANFNPNASPENREMHFANIVKKILSQYPPKR